MPRTRITPEQSISTYQTAGFINGPAFVLAQKAENRGAGGYPPFPISGEPQPGSRRAAIRTGLFLTRE